MSLASYSVHHIRPTAVTEDPSLSWGLVQWPGAIHSPERGLSVWLITRCARQCCPSHGGMCKGHFSQPNTQGLQSSKILPSCSVSVDSSHFRPKPHRSVETKSPARVDVLRVAPSTSRDNRRRTGKERRTRKHTEYLYPKHATSLFPRPDSSCFNSIPSRRARSFPLSSVSAGVSG